MNFWSLTYVLIVFTLLTFNKVGQAQSLKWVKAEKKEEKKLLQPLLGSPSPIVLKYLSEHPEGFYVQTSKKSTIWSFHPDGKFKETITVSSDSKDPVPVSFEVLDHQLVEVLVNDPNKMRKDTFHVYYQKPGEDVKKVFTYHDYGQLKSYDQATSANQQFIGFRTTYRKRDIEELDLKIKVIDQNFNEVYTKNLKEKLKGGKYWLDRKASGMSPINVFFSVMHVDNSGNIILPMMYKDPSAGAADIHKSHPVVFIYHWKEDKFKEIHLTSEQFFWDWDHINMCFLPDRDELVVAGLKRRVSKDGKDAMTGKKAKKPEVKTTFAEGYEGVEYIRLNTQNGEITSQTFYPFEGEVFNDLFDLPEKVKIKDVKYNRMHQFQCLPSADGGTYTLIEGSLFTEEDRSTVQRSASNPSGTLMPGSAAVLNYSGNIICLRTDEKGDVVWKEKIHKFQYVRQTAKRKNAPGIGSFAGLVEDNNLHLVFNTLEKENSSVIHVKFDPAGEKVENQIVKNSYDKMIVNGRTQLIRHLNPRLVPKSFWPSSTKKSFLCGAEIERKEGFLVVEFEE